MIEKLLGFFGINTSVDNQDRITIDHFTKDEYKSISSCIDRATQTEKEKLIEEMKEFYRENLRDKIAVFQLCNDISYSREVCDLLNVRYYSRLDHADQERIELAAYLLYRDYTNRH